MVLGRDPLTEEAANRPMVLTASGYVPLGDQAKPANKRANHVAKDNPYHDERGRFTTADGVDTGAGHPADGRVQVAENASDVAVVAESKDPNAVRKEIVKQVLSYVGSDEWDFSKPKDNFAANTDKCNKFVYDVLTAAGASPGLPNGFFHTSPPWRCTMGGPELRHSRMARARF